MKAINRKNQICGTYNQVILYLLKRPFFMKKAIVSAMIVAGLFLAGMGCAAANTTISSSPYNITAPDTYYVTDGLAVTITSSLHSGVYIVCNNNVQLTISNLDLTTSARASTLTFTGKGNELILDGINKFESTYSAHDYYGTEGAGIRVASGAELTISGSGSVEAIGSKYGAGIGGGCKEHGGTITISSGTVSATGGLRAAGIGGSGLYPCSFTDSEDGTISISGGTITATGGYEAAAIGCGWYINNTKINISGGTITAIGGYGSAGIGGGHAAKNETINISGGTITATAGQWGAGIGTGYQGDGVTINISGGTVIATAGSESAGIGGGRGSDCGAITISGDALVYASGLGPYDIGSSYVGHFFSRCESITITGASAVFLERNKLDDYDPTIIHNSNYTHINKLNSEFLYTNSFVYGINYTDSTPWSTAAGGYFVLAQLDYDANGGSGTVPSSSPVQHMSGIDVPAASGSSLIKSGYTFAGWNTAADRSGNSYAAGDRVYLPNINSSQFTVDSSNVYCVTLYAQWTKNPAATAVPTMPQTGDTQNIWLPLAVMAAGILCLIVYGVFRTKHKK